MGEPNNIFIMNDPLNLHDDYCRNDSSNLYICGKYKFEKKEIKI